MRLDAFLSHHGFGTRSEVRTLLRRGRVVVAGRTCTDAGMKIGDEVVSVDGDPVERNPTAATLLLHKPLGYASSHDPAEAPLVDELIPPPWNRLALNMAGRLDRDTSGLLILTTDGQLIHRLTSPRKHLVKRYRLRYTGHLSAHAVERCAAGLVLDDDPKPTLPAHLELHAEGQATLHLQEGRYHQVRRMLAAVGGTVITLHRDRIGALELPVEMLPGALREVTVEELARLQTMPADLAAVMRATPVRAPADSDPEAS